MSIPDYDALRAAVENEESILGLIGEAMCHPDYDALRAAVENEESILGLLNGAVQNRGTQSEEENRGWVTINGRHVLLRDKGAAGGGGSAETGLTTGGGSGIIHYSSDIVIEDKKIVGYLLNPEKTHYKDFIDIGYSKDNPQELYDDIVSNFNETKAVNHRINYDEYDTYSVFMELGVDKKARFRTVWEIKNKGDRPRLVSAHREDE